VNKGDDCDGVACGAVDEAILVDKDFADCWIRTLGYNPAAIRESLKGTCGGESLLYDAASTLGRVTRDELGDLVEVAPG
jgi:hypothetical protein